MGNTKKVLCRLMVVMVLLGLFFPMVAQGAPEKIRPFSLQRVEDDTVVSHEEFSGKVLLLSFFATWCPPCRVETPVLVKLQEHFSQDDFTVVGISLDNQKEVVIPFLEEFSVNYPVLMANDEVLVKFGAFTIPTVVLIDKNGYVLRRFVGAHKYETFENLINEALE